jgi:hypothetical protein
MANHKAKTCAAILALVALAAGPAAALDGEVLINQKKAKAGGITPNDGPDFPVRITRSGKYKLIGNLNVPAGKNGFNVTANFVTIDLNGFRISGGEIGVNASNADGLTIMNGTITGAASHGILLARPFAVVQDMQITSNGQFGVAIFSSDGRVLRSTISNNNDGGVFCSDRCLIAQNVIAGSALGAGVDLETQNGGGGHLVLGNVIADNNWYGIFASGVVGFANNTLTGNNNGGAQVLGAGLHPVHPNYCEPACP